MSDFTDNPPEPKPPRGTEETDFPVPAQPSPVLRPTGRDRAITIIAAAIVAALVAVVVVFGLQAFHGTVIDQGAIQQGQQTIPANTTEEVYYRRPFRTPPHLTIMGGSGYISILEQKEDHFKVKNSFGGQMSFEWKAEGRPAN
jgi:hypothetical protein